LIAENTILRRIEKEAFTECHSLKSFSVPKSVETIGEDCFKDCHSLSRLSFVSSDLLKQFVGDCTLDEALENIGLAEISTRFRIEIDERGACFEFPGWSSVAHGSSHLVLIQDLP
jgi:hypothetical protein